MTPLPAGEESPKFQTYETIVPSESEEVEALNVTGIPGSTGDGLATNRAIGG